MNNSQRQEQIEEAIKLINQADDLVREAIAGTSEEPHFKAYGGYGLQQLLGNGNQYDTSLFDLSDSFGKEDEDVMGSFDENGDANEPRDEWQLHAESNGQA